LAEASEEGQGPGRSVKPMMMMMTTLLYASRNVGAPADKHVDITKLVIPGYISFYVTMHMDCRHSRII
jgi:hypothetical protein